MKIKQTSLFFGIILLLSACTPAANTPSNAPPENTSPPPSPAPTTVPSNTPVPATDPPAATATTAPTQPPPTPAPIPETFSIGFAAQYLTDAQFSPDGSMLAVTTLHELIVLDTGSWEPIFNHVVDSTLFETGVGGIAWSPDGETLAQSYYHQENQESGILMWKIANWTPRIDLDAKYFVGLDLAFSPDGKFIATKLESGVFGEDRVTVYQSINGNERFETRVNPFVGQQTTSPKNFSGFGWSPDGTLFAVGNTFDESITIWDAKTWKPLYNTVGLFTDGMHVSTWTPDGQYLVGGRSEGGLIVWDVQTGEVAVNLFAHDKAVLDIAFSADGQLMATASADDTVVLWDATSWTILAVLEGHTDNVKAVDFSPDGSLLVSVSNDETIILWNVAQSLALP